MKCLYHANCNDGRGAALAVWLKYGDVNHEYIPVQYGNPPPEGLADEDVVIVDFSYPRETLIQLATIARSILVIDHHKTAKETLLEPFPSMWDSVPLCDVEVVFATAKSGAMLAWEHFHQHVSIPALFKHLQDRDLWKFELEQTKQIHYGLQVYSADFRDWKALIDNPEKLISVMNAGQAIMNFLELEAEKITAGDPPMGNIGNHIVPLFNLPGFMASDTLNACLRKNPNVLFVASYFDLVGEGKRIYQLRSDDNHLDVGEIARRLGGGGHRNSAGFSEALPLRPVASRQ